MDTVNNKLGESIFIIDLVTNVMVIGMSARVRMPSGIMVSQDDALVIVEFVP
jgi:hypothetical protein